MSTSTSVTRERYTGVQIALHWTIAILVVAAYFLAEGMGKLLDEKLAGNYTGGLPLHVIVGLCVLALVVVRFIVRMMQGAPDAPDGTTGLHATAREWGHILLYTLLFLVPIGGVLVWFGGIDAIGEYHGLGGKALLIIAGLHALVALWHHYVRGDGTLKRMMKPAD